MPERQSVSSFFAECGGIVNGYGIKDDQRMPESYDDLLVFIYDRLGIQPEASISVTGLCYWLMSGGKSEYSSWPNADTEIAEAVILMADLPDPDEYVASLPDFAPDRLIIPPHEVVRRLVLEANGQ